MTRISRTDILNLLNGDSIILDVARRVTRVLSNENIEAAVIGGVAVVLHGHIRTTRDVDVFVQEIQRAAEALRLVGAEHDPARGEFILNGVPVHLVTLEQVKAAPRQVEDVEGIRTVSLRDLIEMKLRSGTNDLLRAQDLADVIALIRHHELGESLAANLPAELRSEYRRLVRAIAKSGATDG